MPTPAQAALLALALAALAGVLYALVRSTGITIRALVGRRWSIALGAIGAIVLVLAGAAVVIVAWFARAIGHGEKTIAGDFGLAAVTLVPLAVAGALVGFGAGRLRARLDRSDP
ncbi:MAG: hypothetical protein J0L91_12515 [Burkholderiales bacterium]|nr:hypothetical protein [Burkholderiales bacterium]MCC7113642.1 hypothetical protein [Burkholderiales bacterium]